MEIKMAQPSYLRGCRVARSLAPTTDVGGLGLFGVRDEAVDSVDNPLLDVSTKGSWQRLINDCLRPFIASFIQNLIGWVVGADQIRIASNPGRSARCGQLFFQS